MENSKEENQNLKGKPSIGIVSLIVILCIVIVVLLAILLFLPKDNKEIMVKEKEDKSVAYNSTQDNITEIKENNSVYYMGNSTNNTENVANQNKPSDNEIDKITQELFEKGSEKITELIADDFPDYDEASPREDKRINGKHYFKTTELYANVEKEYSKIFTGEALKNVLNMRFINIDGTLYASVGGSTGWSIANIEVSQIGRTNDEIHYNITYNDVYIDGSISEKKSCKMTLKLVDGTYKISEIGYCGMDNEIDKIAQELFEKGSEKITELIADDFPDYDEASPREDKRINGKHYFKTTELYANVEKEYSKIFTGEALKNVLNMRFINIDGTLYASVGGSTGWSITNIEVSQIGRTNDEIHYNITYNDVYIDGSISEKKYCKMTLKLVEATYKISEINYGDID